MALSGPASAQQTEEQWNAELHLDTPLDYNRVFHQGMQDIRHFYNSAYEDACRRDLQRGQTGTLTMDSPVIKEAIQPILRHFRQLQAEVTQPRGMLDLITDSAKKQALREIHAVVYKFWVCQGLPAEVTPPWAPNEDAYIAALQRRATVMTQQEYMQLLPQIPHYEKLGQVDREVRQLVDSLPERVMQSRTKSK